MKMNRQSQVKMKTLFDEIYNILEGSSEVGSEKQLDDEEEWDTTDCDDAV